MGGIEQDPGSCLIPLYDCALLCVDMADLATKLSSSDDSLVARSAISKIMLHKPDLSADIPDTIVYPYWRASEVGTKEQN